jgi:mRNA-degrading endonuclease YafQ of YafQ-DinJ toxin-antitoxin module
MVQNEIPSLRQLEIISVLTSLGGVANYEKLYRAVRESLTAKDLKITGKATFDKELDLLIKRGLVKKAFQGKRAVYMLSPKVEGLSLNKDWVDKHLKKLSVLIEKFNLRSELAVEKDVRLVYMIGKANLNLLLNQLFSYTIHGRDLKESIDYFMEYLGELVNIIRGLSPEQKAKIYNIIKAERIRDLFLIELMVREAYRKLR